MTFETEIEKITNDICDFASFGKKMGLENIKKICEEIGNPQDSYKTIHIAGTNGKGSVATTIETILIEAKYKVGKFTSPHITKINERITLNGESIADSDFIKYFKIINNVIKKLEIEPTFFEVITAMMFLYFKDNGITYLILETGLGGRFDSTNISKSDFALITNISYDHCGILGNTLDEIAIEKLGIIKQNSIVLISELNLSLQKGLEKVQFEKVIFVEEKYEDSSYNLDFINFKTKIKIGNTEYIYSLFGHHQYKNFLLAYALAVELKIESKIIESAIQKVVWQCRFQVIEKNDFSIILDGSHNESGISNLKNTLLEHYLPEEIITITSILEDKDIPLILKEIGAFSNDIIFTSLTSVKRGIDGNKMNELWESILDNPRKELTTIHIENNIENTLKKAIKSKKKIIVVCGSFYLLSKFKEVLQDV